MENKNGYWTDARNNTWNAVIWTLEQALKFSESLSDCSGCREQPIIYSTSRIGSRKSPTFFYSNKGKIFVSCGCFRGTFQEFQTKVRNTYPDKDNQQRIEYEKEIKTVGKLWPVIKGEKA